MSLLRLKRDVAYGGAVVFNMVGYRPQRYYTILSELADALPSLKSGDGAVKIPSGAIGGDIAMFLACVGHTAEIEFALTEQSPDDLLAFRDWWVKVLPQTDMATAFRTFTAILSPEVLNVWYTAYENTRGVQVSAPPELQPEAAATSEADTDFTSGAIPS